MADLQQLKEYLFKPENALGDQLRPLLEQGPSWDSWQGLQLPVDQDGKLGTRRDIEDFSGNLLKLSRQSCKLPRYQHLKFAT